MAAARVNWHGQDLPVVREIVRIDGVETAVEIPELGEPELRQIVALLAALDRYEGAARLAPYFLLELVAGLYIKLGGTVQKWRAYETMLGVRRSSFIFVTRSTCRVLPARRLRPALNLPDQ